MNDEIFDAISNQLDKSGVTVSKKLDGTILVTLPDSDMTLATCTDNGDGTLAYTLYLGDESNTSGNGTPDQFKSSVLDALDTWIEFVPYEQNSIEPSISPEYRSAIGESRDDTMRRSLFEMGLEEDQADAIMEVAHVLLEANMVHVKVGSRDLTGTSLHEIAANKDNRPYLERQWILRELRLSNNLDASDRVASLGDLKKKIQAIPGKRVPTTDDLYALVKENSGTVEVEKIQTDDDVLGSAWNQFGGSKADSSNKVTGKNRTTSAVIDNEAPIESGESDDYDEELGHQETHTAFDDNAEEKSERSLGDVTGVDTTDFGVKEVVVEKGKNGKNGNETETVSVKDVENPEGDAEETNEEMPGDIIAKWSGDASELGVSAIDPNYDLPEGAIAKVEEKATELKDSFSDIIEAIPSISSRPVSLVLQLMFGKPTPGAGVRGAVLRLINGDQATLAKIETGDGILNADKATPAMRKELSDALDTELVKSAIDRVQAEFADFIKEVLPEAYDEACGIESGSEQSAYGHIEDVDDDFVNLFRSILFDRKLPFGGYPWSVVEKMCTDLGSIMKIGKVTAVPTGTGSKAAIKKPAVMA